MSSAAAHDDFAGVRPGIGRARVARSRTAGGPDVSAIEWIQKEQREAQRRARERLQEMMENPPEIKPEDNPDLWR